jgi:hypothetical protein
MRSKRFIMSVIFAILGIPLNRALTATLSPSFLLMSLRILKHLKDLKSSDMLVKLIIEKKMIRKSP